MKYIEKYKDEIKSKIKEKVTLDCAIADLRGYSCDGCFQCTNCGLKSLDWLLQEYKEPIKPILTDKDKIIIKDIIKAFEPFGKKLKYITKYSWSLEPKVYYLNFEYKGDDFDTLNFIGDDFFVGMELDKAYTPEELGL